MIQENISKISFQVQVLYYNKESISPVVRETSVGYTIIIWGNTFSRPEKSIKSIYVMSIILTKEDHNVVNNLERHEKELKCWLKRLRHMPRNPLMTSEYFPSDLLKRHALFFLLTFSYCYHLIQTPSVMYFKWTTYLLWRKYNYDLFL